MTAPAAESLARFCTGLSVIALLLATRRPRWRRFETAAHAFAAAAGIAAFLNFGVFHHHHDDHFVNTWEQFHYQLGSRYFPELGYDGLYAASLAAQSESRPESRLPRDVRHLPTNTLTPTAGYGAFVHQVRSRFTDERWRAFLTDHDVYLAHTPRSFWRHVRRDHGYNPTPAWTFAARLLSARLPSGWTSLVLLSLLDLALLAAAIALLYRTFGAHSACLALAVCGLGFGWRYLYLGAFLRLDWLLAAVAGVCLLERRRFAAAGACFGWAASVRLFPLLLLAGPALHALRAVLRGERPRWALRLGAGLAAALALAAAAGALAGRGPGAWVEFGDRMRVYGETWAANMVGLDTALLADPGFLADSFRGPGAVYDASFSREGLAARRGRRALAAAALLGLAGAAMWRAPLAQSAVLGLVPIFALLHPGAYYWILLLLVPVRGGLPAALGVLALHGALQGVRFAYGNAGFQQFWYALQAWGLLLFFAIWTLAPARPQSAAGRTPAITRRATSASDASAPASSTSSITTP